MEFELKKVLLALLFSSSDALTPKDVQDVFTRYHRQMEDWAAEAGDEDTEQNHPQSVMATLLQEVPSLLTTVQIRNAFSELAVQLQEEDSVYRLHEGPTGYRMALAPRYADWVRLFRNEPRPRKLSAAALETLAIIAYRQPVTRVDLEAIRGVSADSALNRLLEKDLIRITGRAELPGRPLQYGTTEVFLDFCGIKSLDELPASDVLSPNQINEWIRRATHPEPSPDAADVGLPND